MRSGMVWLGVIHGLLLRVEFQDRLQTLLLLWSQVRPFLQVICDDADVPPEVAPAFADGFTDFLAALSPFLTDTLISFQRLFAVVAGFDFTSGLFVETVHDGFQILPGLVEQA